MPRKKQKPESIADELKPELLTDAEPAPNLPESDDDRKERALRKGVFIPFNQDGTLDEKRLKGETWKVDAVRRAVGTGESGGVSSGFAVNDDFVRGIYKGFEFALSRVGTMFLKWPAELAAEMHYSDEQLVRLVPPTKAVLEKLAPSWLVKHQEIATLAVVLTAETGEMVQGALRAFILKHPELVEQMTKKTNGSAEPEENRAIA